MVILRFLSVLIFLHTPNLLTNERFINNHENERFQINVFRDRSER